MTLPQRQFGRAAAILLTAGYLPAIISTPWLLAMNTMAVIIIPLSPIALPWLVLDMSFPQIPRSPFGFWIPGILILIIYLLFLGLLARTVCRSTLATLCAAIVVFLASLSQWLIFLFWAQSLGG